MDNCYIESALKVKTKQGRIKFKHTSMRKMCFNKPNGSNGLCIWV